MTETKQQEIIGTLNIALECVKYGAPIYLEKVQKTSQEVFDGYCQVDGLKAEIENLKAQIANNDKTEEK